MAFTSFIYVFFLAGLGVFLIGLVARVIGYANAPIHLRWELYPVPHEAPDRAEHGGSYFESSDWWTQPKHFNFTGELRAMLAEMIFLKGLREFNRKLWRRSFPFHFGLYLLIAGAVVMLAAAALQAFSPGLAAGGVGGALQIIYTVLGWAGAALVLVGSMGLLHRRLTDDDLKNFTAPGDLFNLIFFAVTVGVFCADSLFRSPGYEGMSAFALGLLTWNTQLAFPPLFAAGIVLSAALLAYIPFTHMAHFVGKYFTYHSVRWNDDPLVRGGKLEKKMAAYLTYRPTWAAPHMRADGKSSWADLATVNPAQEKSK